MKQSSGRVFLVVAALILGSSLTAWAMPSDAESGTWQTKGIIQPDVTGAVAVGFGATGDFVLDRTLEDTTDLEASWYGGNVYLDPHERIHLTLFAGVADLQLGNVSLDRPGGTKVELETETDFAYGGSGRLDILDFPLWPNQPNAWFFATGGYRYTNPDVESATFLSRAPSVLQMQIEVHEWQATLGVSQRINDLIPGFGLVPYAGVQYNEIDLELTGTGRYPSGGLDSPQTIQPTDTESDDMVGVVCGLQVMAWEDRVSVSVEGRFVTETAVSANGRLRW